MALVSRSGNRTITTYLQSPFTCLTAESSFCWSEKSICHPRSRNSIRQPLFGKMMQRTAGLAPRTTCYHVLVIVLFILKTSAPGRLFQKAEKDNSGSSMSTSKRSILPIMAASLIQTAAMPERQCTDGLEPQPAMNQAWQSDGMGLCMKPPCVSPSRTYQSVLFRPG